MRPVAQTNSEIVGDFFVGDRSAIFFSFACFLVARRSGAAAVFPSGLSHVNTCGRSDQDTLLLRPTSRKQIAVVLLDMPSRGVHV